MQSVQKQFQDWIISQQLLSKKDHVLLAVSGGLDSMVMAELFLRTEFTIGIAHCNFNLRGSESDEDAYFVRKWAEKHKITYYEKSFNLGEGSTQLNARSARYQWFQELLAGNSYHKIATAHHLNDSLETHILNLVRGTGIKGVAGIRPKTGHIIRPLLSTTRQMLKTFAIGKGIKWREDSSNESKKYDRNYVRQEIIPGLESLNPSIANSYRFTQERLRQAEELVDREINKIRDQFLHAEGSGFKLDVSWIDGQQDLLILDGIVAAFGFNYTTVREIYAALGSSGKKFLSNQYELSIDCKSINIKSKEKQIDKEVIIKEGQTVAFSNRELIFSKQKRENITISSDASMAFLDAEKLTFPIKVRKWCHGDRFCPLGMSGEKKVSDFLIDMKVPLSQKEDVWVLECDGKIAWIIGFRISDCFKLTTQTEDVFIVEVRS